jgi:antitoxin (DNA-binding transcriptional repressor) of toxin-antitoxin stability system
MVSITIQHAKTYLSRYAKHVKAGQTLILCERNKPIAEIRSIAPARV